MTDLRLQPAPARGPNDYELIADDWIVGRIVLSDASPVERPWLWSLDQEFCGDRSPTHGYEATREAAMVARQLLANERRKRTGGGDVRLFLLLFIVAITLGACQNPARFQASKMDGAQFCVGAREC